MVNTGIGKITGAPTLAETAQKALPIVGESVASNVVNGAAEALASLVEGVNKAMPSILPTATAALASLSFRGTQGNFTTISYPIVLRADFMYISGMDRENRGTPVNRRLKVGELSGFALFEDVHMETSGNMTQASCEALERLLMSGVYLEWGGMD